MHRVAKFIPKATAPIQALVILTMLLAIILFTQKVIEFGIQYNTTVWNGSCSFTGWNESGDVGMIVDCGEHGGNTLTNNSLIRSYLNNPGPLMCEQSAIGDISCEDRPPLEGSNS